MAVLFWILITLAAIVAVLMILLAVVIWVPGRFRLVANTIGFRRIDIDYDWSMAGVRLEMLPDEGDLFVFVVIFGRRFSVFSSTEEERSRKRIAEEEKRMIEVATRTFHDRIHDMLQKLERLITGSIERDITEELIVGLFKGFGPIAVRMVKKVIHSSRFRTCALQVAYGADDPAETGRIFGYGSAAMPFLNLSDRVQLELLPSFERRGLFFNLNLTLTVYLYRLLGAFVVMMFQLSGLWRRERKKLGFGLLPRRTGV